MPWQNPLVSVLWLMLSASVSLTKNGFSTWIHLRIKNTAWTFLPIFVCFFLFKNVKAFVNTFSAFIFLPYSLGHSPSGQDTADANLQKLTQLVNKESNLIEKMDDNLRKSPQHPPRKITTLKLAAGGGESSPLNRLSPWQLLLHTHICLPSILLNITAIFLTNVVLQGKNLLMGSSREETQLYNILSLIFKKTSSSGLLHAKLKLKY